MGSTAMETVTGLNTKISNERERKIEIPRHSGKTAMVTDHEAEGKGL